MASYKVVEVYTDITDCTLHCRVQFFLSCVEHSHSFLMSVRCHKKSMSDLCACSKVYLVYTCQCCVEEVVQLDSFQWITSLCRN